MKKVILSVIAISAALLVLLSFFVDNEIVDRAGALLTEGAMVLAAFAMILGFFNLLSVHAARVRRRERGWTYSAILALTVLMMFVFGVEGPGSPGISWIYRYIYTPLQATLFSLLAFFIVSAAYRAFRVRSWESALFVIAGIVVLLGQIPIAELIWRQLPVLKDWVLSVPVTAGTRGILLGAALGTVITGLRLLLAVDRPYL